MLTGNMPHCHHQLVSTLCSTFRVALSATEPWYTAPQSEGSPHYTFAAQTNALVLSSPSKVRVLATVRPLPSAIQAAVHGRCRHSVHPAYIHTCPAITAPSATISATLPPSSQFSASYTLGTVSDGVTRAGSGIMCLPNSRPNGRLVVGWPSVAKSTENRCSAAAVSCSH